MATQLIGTPSLIGGWPRRISGFFELFEEDKTPPQHISVETGFETVSFERIEPVYTSILSFEDVQDTLLRNFEIILEADDGIKVEPNQEEELLCFPFGFEVWPEFKGTPKDFPSKCQTVMQYLVSEGASLYVQSYERGNRSPRLRYAKSGLVCPQKHRGEFLTVYSDKKGIRVTTLKRFKKAFPERSYGVCPVLPCTEIAY